MPTPKPRKSETAPAAPARPKKKMRTTSVPLDEVNVPAKPPKKRTTTKKSEAHDEMIELEQTASGRIRPSET